MMATTSKKESFREAWTLGAPPSLGCPTIFRTIHRVGQRLSSGSFLNSGNLHVIINYLHMVKSVASRVRVHTQTYKILPVNLEERLKGRNTS